MNLNLLQSLRGRTPRHFFASLGVSTGSFVLLSLLLPSVQDELLISETELYAPGVNQTVKDLRNVFEYGFMEIFTVNLIRLVLCWSALIFFKLGFFNIESRGRLHWFYWGSFSLAVVITAKMILFNFEAASRVDKWLVILVFIFSWVDQIFFNALYTHLLPAAVESEFEEKQKNLLQDEKQKPGLTNRELWILVKPYFLPDGWRNRFRCVLTFFFLTASKVLRLFAPIFIGRAVDEVSNAFSGSYVDLYATFRFIAAYSLLNVLSSYSAEMQKVIYLKVGQVAYVQIARTTFTHLHSLSLNWHLNKKMGSVLRSMDRGVSAANTIVRVLFLNLLPTFGELIAVFIIFYTQFDVKLLSAVLFLSITGYGVFTFRITMWRKTFRRRTNKHDNDFHDQATDSLINYETVKYFGNEDFETNRYTNSIYEFQRNSNITAATLSMLNAAQQTFIQIALLLGLFTAAASIILDGELSVGDFVSAQIYLLNVFTPLTMLGFMYSSVIEAFVDITNLSQLLAENPDIVDAKDAVPLVTPPDGLDLEFRDVGFSYPSNADSGVRDLSFVVPTGSSLGIVGQTGAGKTTISRLLFRFYEPQEGVICLGGQDISKVTMRSLRKSIGVVPQDCVLFNDTVMHNIKYGNVNASQAEVRAACEAAQILDLIMSLPEGFDTKVGERGLRLSGGEKQRISIARCLLKDPPIVLLDEATSALDTKTEKKVQTALNGLAQNRTSIVIAHRLATVKDCDSIAVLDAGSIVEQGTHHELLRKKGAYSSLWNAQQQMKKEAKVEPKS